MAYKVQWHEDIWKDIEKLDKDIARKIIERVRTYLVHDPIKLGKALTGQFMGLYRDRYGDYRVLYVVDLGKEIIMVLEIDKPGAKFIPHEDIEAWLQSWGIKKERKPPKCV